MAGGTIIPDWAYRGNEVACVMQPKTDIKNVWGPPTPPGSVVPVKGKTYFIAEVETYRRRVFLTLTGLDPLLCWDVRYFGPLRSGDEKRDIAIFREIADKVPAVQLTLLPEDEPVF